MFWHKKGGLAWSKMINGFNQGRTKWTNCRLSNKNPDYQLVLAILAHCWQLDTKKYNFHSKNSCKLNYYIISRVHYV